MDRALLVRAAALYVPLSITALVWLWRPPSARARGGAILATLWNLPALLAVHVVAARFGWWTFDAAGGTIAGLPVDLYIGWAVLWGALPLLAAPRIPVALLAALAVLVDLLAMPAMVPVVGLGDWWLIGDVAAIAGCLVPAQLLGRWTAEDRELGKRATLQVIAFAGLVLGVLTQAILEQAGGSWRPLLARPGWFTALAVQCLAAAGLLGLSAVQEFATRGGGTPVPFDPPRRLVMTGPYAYVRNPMQLSAALVLVGWGALLQSWPLMAASVVAVIYGAGFARGDEGEDLRARFGGRWQAYAARVRAWVPRWRPLDRTAVPELGIPNDTGAGSAPTGRAGPARLYVAEECGPCSEVRAWFARRSPVGLEIVAAERHPTRSLSRITYDAGDGGPEEEGVAAVARGVEHIDFGWALVGMLARLPILRPLLQVLVDASGAGPREVVRYCDRGPTARVPAA